MAKAAASKRKRASTDDAASSPPKKPAPSTTSSSKRSSSRRTATQIVYKDTPSPSPDDSPSEDDSEDAWDGNGHAEASADDLEEDEDDISSLSSENLDDEAPASRRGSGRTAGKVKKAVKKTKKANMDDEDDYEALPDDIELEEGQMIAARIHPAPTSGWAKPGQVSRHTMRWLKNLQDPKKNDREWFKTEEPTFRMAEKEWQAFVQTLTAKMRAVDTELPAMPPKDLIHRIYRDVRFSSDKTPYKQSFSFSVSRSGRKGIYAMYYMSIKPGGGSIIAGGLWQPGKQELANFRQAILRDSSQLRAILTDKQFEKYFGKAKSTGNKRSSVFGHDDMLKVAPKGIAKDHAEIDLLKLRSIAVVHHFDDELVMSPDFIDELVKVLTVMRPFVHLLNGYLSIPPATAEPEEA